MYTSRTLRRILLRVAMLAGLSLSLALAVPVSARDAAYETAAGTTIGWGEEWVESLTMTGVEELNGFGEFEMISFDPADSDACATSYCGLSIVVYDAANADPESVSKSYVKTKLTASGTEVLAEHENDGVLWAFIGSGSTTSLSYTYQIGDEVFAVTLTADADSMVSYLESANDTISIDDDDLFAELDIADIEDAL